MGNLKFMKKINSNTMIHNIQMSVLLNQKTY